MNRQTHRAENKGKRPNSSQQVEPQVIPRLRYQINKCVPKLILNIPESSIHSLDRSSASQSQMFNRLNELLTTGKVVGLNHHVFGSSSDHAVVITERTCEVDSLGKLLKAYPYLSDHQPGDCIYHPRDSSSIETPYMTAQYMMWLISGIVWID